MFRSILSIFLSCVIALASASLAQARHYDGGGTKMVLCTDAGYQTVTIDARGNRVPVTHPCPDCVAAMGAQDLPAPLQVLLPIYNPRLAKFAQISRNAAGQTPPPAHARGPPC